MTDTAAVPGGRPTRQLHPLSVRIMHWTNALAIFIMIGSGWKIYQDEVLFGWLHFPDAITIGGEMQGALQWHFLAMWILVVNGIAYVIYGFATGRFRRMLFPIRTAELVGDIRDAVHLRLGHENIARYNAVQKLLYTGILLVGVVQVLSGLAIWKPVQMGELTELFGGFQGARLVHFFGMAAFVLFLLVHITLALIVPRTLRAMLTGGPPVDQAPGPRQPPPDPPATPATVHDSG